MENEQENFLASIEVEGEDPFRVNQEQPEADAKGEETPAESPTEKKPEGEKPSQEGGHTPGEEKIPFHKHPRWIAMQREREDLRKKVEELEEKSKEMQMVSQKDEEVSLPNWWVIANGDTDLSKQAFQDFLQSQKSEREKIKQEIVAEQRAQEQKNAEETKRWENLIESELSKLQDDGLQFDRNELLSIVAEFSPKDSDGKIVGPYISFRKAYDILELKNATIKKEKEEIVQKKKNTASLTTPDNSGRENDASSLTWSQLRKKGWGSF